MLLGVVTTTTPANWLTFAMWSWMRGAEYSGGPSPLPCVARVDPARGEALDNKWHPRAHVCQPVHPVRDRPAAKLLQRKRKRLLLSAAHPQHFILISLDWQLPIQWNLWIKDTFGTSHFVLCKEVVLFRRLFCTEVKGRWQKEGH